MQVMITGYDNSRLAWQPRRRSSFVVSFSTLPCEWHSELTFGRVADLIAGIDLNMKLSLIAGIDLNMKLRIDSARLPIQVRASPKPALRRRSTLTVQAAARYRSTIETNQGRIKGAGLLREANPSVLVAQTSHSVYRNRFRINHISLATVAAQPCLADQ